MTDDSISPGGATEAKEQRLLRPEIQALRAIAVATVVIFHYWPELISGGYIGVDVFFAISGFLITAHLVREVDRSGHVSLPGFWARRARRILPAALLVLLFCAVATYLIVPQNLWENFFREIQASTLYVENWYLAGEAVDYLGAENRPSPVQHYWSLSVEEQFYIVWPVLILIAMLVARKGSALLRRRSITAMLVLLTAVSLAYSIWATANNPVEAFFITPTRVWEFGAGGVLAMLAATKARPALRAAVSWAGIAMILTAAFAYNSKTPFPGIAAALPIAGTLAVIWAGSPELRWSPLHWMKLRATQSIGDISYAIYLWHWPLLILTGFLLLEKLGTPVKLVLVALTLLLAAISKRFVEDPLRSGPLLASHRPRRSFAFVLAGMGTVLLASFAALAVLSDKQSSDSLATAQLLASGEPCLGAAARDPENQPCINPRLRLTVSPLPLDLEKLAETTLKPKRCPRPVSGYPSISRICDFGVPSARAKDHLAIIGDSHSLHWRPALRAAANKRRWNMLSTSLLGCPFNAKIQRRRGLDPEECVAWKRAIPGWLAGQPKVDTLIVAQLSQPYKGKSIFERDVAGYQQAWRTLPPSIKTIIVIRDNPRAGKETVDCIERAIADRRPAGEACALPRKRVLDGYPDAAAVAARRLNDPNVGVVDLTPFFCGRDLCYPVIGGLLVTSDKSHFTPSFNGTLTPYLLRALDRGGWLTR